MNRRSAIATVAAWAFVAPLARATTAPGKVRMARVVIVTASPPVRETDEWFRNAAALFATHGLEHGKNIQLLVVGYGGRENARESLAREVVAGHPDVIGVSGSHDALLLQRLTREVPIVFVNVADPVKLGLVQSFQRPGENVTGVSNRLLELVGKRIELLKELLPRARRIAVLMNEGPDAPLVRAEVAPAANRAGLEWVEVEPGSADAARKLGQSRAHGVVSFASWSRLHRAGLMAVLERLALPCIFPFNQSVTQGGLISLGERFREGEKRGTAIIARIVKGEKPGSIPIDQLSSIYLAVNLRTARALKIDIPPSIRLRADEVIE
jgi:putative ABC transport system substrate-binding protein